MKSKKNKFLALGTIIAVVVNIGICVGEQKVEAIEKAKTIVDMGGRSVEVPVKVNRVVGTHGIITQIVFALAPDKIVCVDGMTAGNKAFPRVDPRFSNLLNIGDVHHGINEETVISINPDVIIDVLWGGGGRLHLQEKLGIPTVFVQLPTPKVTLGDSIRFIGRVLGKENRANKLVSFYENKLNRLDIMLSQIPESEKVTVYGGGFNLLTTHRPGWGVYQAITRGGGIDVVKDESSLGGSIEVSIEQLLKWNPDVIIVDAYCKDSVESISSDPRFQTIKAIKDKRVYQEPSGLFISWLRPGPEGYLGPIWVANKLYPHRFNFNMREEARNFYYKVYRYNISDEELSQIFKSN